jgi:threonylcarbamoyladenosine tRNA methylthiotransferase MtaB
MAENTARTVEACGLTFLHVFPFSARRGTPAARMPQVPRPMVKDRAARLRELGQTLVQRRLAAELGATRAVLVERPGFGRTEHFVPVSLDGGEAGEIVTTRIRGAGSRALLGEAIKEAV